MSSIMLPPTRPPELGDFGWFERQFGTSQEPYDVRHLVGPMVLYNCVDWLEEKVDKGIPLSTDEQVLLRSAEADIREEYYDR